MTYERFEDLPVWQKAAELYETTEDLLENEAFRASRGFRDQLDRAALSVSNNIAEGFERGTTNELLQFIYIARGSAGEVRSMLCLKERRARKAAWRADLKSQISNPPRSPARASCAAGPTRCKTQKSRASAT
ncbi:MAG: four helix bundle protein [Verrucomicrobiota bacterium]